VVDFSPDDRLLSAADTTSAAVFEILGLERVCTIFAPAFGKDQCVFASTVDFSPDSTLLATASNNTVQVFDAKKSALLATVRSNLPSQTSLRFYADGKTLAVQSKGTGLTLHSFSFLDGKFQLRASEATGQFRNYIFGSLQYDGAPPLCFTSMPESKTIVWDSAAGSVLQTLNDQPSLFDMVVSPDKKWIATSYRYKNAQIWSLATGKPVAVLGGGNSGGLLGFSPSGRWLACSGTGADHLLWNPETWTRGPVLPPQVEAETGRFAFSYDETLLAVSMFDQVGLVSLPAGEFLGLLEQRMLPNPLCRLRFSPDGSQLAAQGADNSLTLWNLGELKRELRALNLYWE